MAISLSSLRRQSADGPPRIMLYGEPGRGKTTLASEFPNPVVMQLEDGTPAGVDWVGWSASDLPTYQSVLDAMDALIREDSEFQTLVIDSMTALQKMIFAHVCEKGGVGSIEDFGYGKGYGLALTEFNVFVRKMNEIRTKRGLAVVLIAHASIEKFSNPEGDAYNRYDIDLYKSEKVNIRGIIEAEMDAIFFLKEEISIKKEGGNKHGRAIGEGGSNIFIRPKGRAAYTAKNRWGIVHKIRFEIGRGFSEIARFLPGGVDESPPIESADQPATDQAA
jgi:hypothetical protein